MAEIKRSCENCGNLICATSLVAIRYDECIRTDYQTHWRPKQKEEKQATDFDKECKQIQIRNRGF